MSGGLNNNVSFVAVWCERRGLVSDGNDVPGPEWRTAANKVYTLELMLGPIPPVRFGDYVTQF